VNRKTADLASMPCSVARTLAVLGDGWTLMVLRDAFRGTRRFDDFQTSLGIATNTLAERLRHLTDAGVLEKTLYHDHPPRYEYVLTPKGRDLHPVIIGLSQWGDRHLAGPEGPPRVYVHDTCGHVVAPELVCPACRETIVDGVHSIPAAEAARASRARRPAVRKRSR
jgi:DNA-binding HxlR family transcriptional regulator